MLLHLRLVGKRLGRQPRKLLNLLILVTGMASLHHKACPVGDLQDEPVAAGDVLQSVAGFDWVLDQDWHGSVHELVPGF